MILIGIDDTDTIDTPGTNQLARRIVEALTAEFRCLAIVRHQLFFDPRIPYTSKNGSASIWLEPRGTYSPDVLLTKLRHLMQEFFVVGSDPGLCIATDVPPPVTAYAERCKREIITQDAAHATATAAGIHLEGLGGTEGGVIGALAAVGLAMTQNDGRIVQWGEWPDDLSELQSVSTLAQRGIAVRELETGRDVHLGDVDVGKHLRPNLVQGQAVLSVMPHPEITGTWLGLKRT